MEATNVDRLTEIRRVISTARETWHERGEVVFDSGVEYLEHEPVMLRLRKRGRRYDIDDDGGATRIAGKPGGSLEIAERVVASQGFNFNRRGVVSVSVVEGRDLASLALRLADISLAVCSSLFEVTGRR